MDVKSLSRERLHTARPVAKLRQGRNDWYRIQNAVDGQSRKATVYIYDEIGYFGVSAADFVRDVGGLDVDEIELHINSPGGDAFDGIAIYNVLQQHPAKVTTHVDSLAASAASFIAMQDRVVVTKQATLMIHDAHGLVIGNAADMRDTSELLDKISDTIASIYADKTGGTVEEFRAMMRDETWFNAEEAMAAGLVDEIQGASSTAENGWDLSIFAYAGRSKAPAPKLNPVNIQVGDSVTNGPIVRREAPSDSTTVQSSTEEAPTPDELARLFQSAVASGK